MIDRKNIDDCYLFYSQNSKTPVSSKLYKEIVYGFFKFIIRKVLEGFEVHLSGGHTLGTLSVQGTKLQAKVDEETGEIKGLPIDWKTTKQMWEKYPEQKYKEYYYHLNEHSGGVLYSLHWRKESSLLINKYLYAFIPCRANKRTVPKKVREGNEYYVHDKSSNYG